MRTAHKFRIGKQMFTVRELVDHEDNVWGISNPVIRARLTAGDNTLARVFRKPAPRRGGEFRKPTRLSRGSDLTHDDMTVPPETPPDVVNHPPHYTTGPIEAIEAISAALTPEEFRGYLKGNAIKYMWRERFKGGDVDLRKAAWYVGRLLPK